jgi:hypothetical protein
MLQEKRRREIMRGNKFLVIRISDLAVFGGESMGREIWRDWWPLGYIFKSVEDIVDFSEGFVGRTDMGIYSVQEKCIYDLNGGAILRDIADDEIKAHLDSRSPRERKVLEMWKSLQEEFHIGYSSMNFDQDLLKQGIAYFEICAPGKTFPRDASHILCIRHNVSMAAMRRRIKAGQKYQSRLL